MIIGLITIVTLLVIRLPSATGARPALPKAMALPEGLTAQAVTMGQGWVGVVATGASGEEFLVFDGTTGALRQRLPIATGPGAP